MRHSKAPHKGSEKALPCLLWVWAGRAHSHLSSLEGAVSACFASPASTSLKHTQDVTLPVVPVVLMGYV